MQNQTSPQEAGTLKPGIENLFSIISGEIEKRTELAGEQGDALNGLLEEARQAIAGEDYAAAETHLGGIVEREPELGAAQAAVLYALIAQEKWEAFEEREKALLQTASNADEQADIQAMVANLLGELGHYGRVVERLEALVAEHPERKSGFAALLSAAYIRTGREADAWSVVEEALPAEGEEKPEHLPLLVAQINRVIDLKNGTAGPKSSRASAAS